MKLKIKKSDLYKKLLEKKKNILFVEKNNNKENDKNKEIENDKNKIFLSIYEKNKRKIYKTYLFQSIRKMEINKNNIDRFYISLLNFKKRLDYLNLYKKMGDRFLRILYEREILKEAITMGKENDIKEIFYIEFRFMTGSVFLALNEIKKVIRKEYDTEQSKSVINKIIELENNVYKFYNKKLENGIFINYLKTFNS